MKNVAFFGSEKFHSKNEEMLRSIELCEFIAWVKKYAKTT